MSNLSASLFHLLSHYLIIFLWCSCAHFELRTQMFAFEFLLLLLLLFLLLWNGDNVMCLSYHYFAIANQRTIRMQRVYTKTPISMNEFYEWLLFVHRQLRKRRTPPWMEMIQAHGGQSVNVNVCVTQIENCNVWAWKMCKYVQCIFSTAIYRHCLRLSGLSLPIFLPNSLPISLTMFSNDVPNARFCLIFLSISTGLRTHIDCTRTRQMLCCAHSAPLPH